MKTLIRYPNTVKIFTLLLILCSVNQSSSYAQSGDREFAKFPANDTNYIAPTEHPRNALTGFLNMGPVFHSTSFKGLPDAPSCCPEYTGTTGFSIGFGTGVKHYIERDWTIGTQVGLDFINGSFDATEPTTLIVGGKATAGSFAHTASMSFAQLSVVNDVAYTFSDPFYGFAGLGFHILMGSNLEQQEALVNPVSTGTFTGTANSRVRNQYNGTMLSVNDIMLSLRLGGGGIYWLDPAKEYAIEGRLWYQLYVGSPVNRIDNWTMHTIRLGVLFYYTLDTTTFM